ncbi:MAG: BlaI/MecI/CopY family transcriptional regulator [Thermoanaerobaculia bacterium]
MSRQDRGMVPKERLSPSEWQLMRICWRLGRANVRQVLREDLKTHIRDYRTILTFMTRMTKKGWLEVEKEGNTNYYRPMLEQRQALGEEIHQFLDQVVGPEPENLDLVEEILAETKRPA